MIGNFNPPKAREYFQKSLGDEGRFPVFEPRIPYEASAKSADKSRKLIASVRSLKGKRSSPE